MTTATKAPKSVNNATNLDLLNKQIAERYSTLVNHDGEIDFVLHVAQLMEQGSASVRSVQESIASVQGTAPTIRKSHAQFFTIFAKIVKTQSKATTYTVSDLLKLSERVSRNHGAEKAGEVIELAKDMADLEAKSPTQTKSKKNAKATKTTGALTVEQVISASLEALRRAGKKNIKDMKTSDLDTLRALLESLVIVQRNSMPAKDKANA